MHPDRPDWNRFYAGGYFGAGIGEAYDNQDYEFNGVTHGPAAGLQLGVNFDTGAFVWGIEGDVGNGAVKWQHSTSNGASLEVISSVRGRVGKPIDNHLIYVTGGAGILTIEAQRSNDYSNRETLVRPVVGIGIESMLNHSVSIKAKAWPTLARIASVTATATPR